MLGDSNGGYGFGAAMTYGQYLGLDQFKTLRVLAHPINRYYIGNDDHYRYNTDEKIAVQIGLKKQQYQEIIIENFGGKVRGNNIYFKEYDNAALALGWINSMRTMQKLRTSK